MSRRYRASSYSRLLGLAALAWCGSVVPAHSMGYSLVDDGWWPADVRNRIIAAMDEAVATYNAHGYFNT